MPKTSAGILAYRTTSSGLELFLVHPGGPFYVKKDIGVWSIPKGQFTEDEDAFEAAKREFFEETGISLDGDFITLTAFKQKAGKIVQAWAIETDFDAAAIKSNMFEMEWPPRSGKNQSFPEVDRAAWWPVDEAMNRILPSQQVMVTELVRRLGT